MEYDEKNEKNEKNEKDGTHSSVPMETFTMKSNISDEEEPKTGCQKFVSFLRAVRQWVGILVTRLLFLVLSFAAITVAVLTVKDQIPLCYLLYLPISLLFAEMIFTIKKKKNGEWKWVTPCIFALLLCIVPSIWIMEVQKFNWRMDASLNQTIQSCDDKSIEEKILDSNITKISISSEFTELGDANKTFVDKVSDIFDKEIINKQIDELSEKAKGFCLCVDCVNIMEQGLLGLLIIGRWLLPKAMDLTDDQKAQLLLVNIAVAADILDLFELMEEKPVQANLSLIVGILIVWTMSLLQFGVVGTATAEKSRFKCFQTEMWSLMTLLCLNDLTFLIIRLVCMIQFNVRSFNTYFFTAKNALILILDVNRIYSLNKELNLQAKRENSERQQQPSVLHLRR